MKSNIYKMLEKFFDDPMTNIAKKMGYSEDNILILENNVERLKEDFPETYNNLKSCQHNRDSRSEIEYAQDLICSWIFEDYLVLNLKNNGLKIELSGADFERKILKSSKVSSKSDLVIHDYKKDYYIEIVNDYGGYWLKEKKIDLRDDKYLHLKKLCTDNSRSLLLGIDFLNGKFFVCDIERNDNVTFIPFHYPFRKPAYSLGLEGTTFYEFSFEKICDVLKQFIEGEEDE